MLIDLHYFQNLIQTYSLENLLGERKKAHQVMLTGKPYLDGDSASSSEEGEDENNRNNLKELVGKESPLSQFLNVGHIISAGLVQFITYRTIFKKKKVM